MVPPWFIDRSAKSATYCWIENGSALKACFTPPRSANGLMRTMPAAAGSFCTLARIPSSHQFIEKPIHTGPALSGWSTGSWMHRVRKSCGCDSLREQAKRARVSSQAISLSGMSTPLSCTRYACHRLMS
ncbi:hypothetical protein DBA29_11310 [Xenophilus aerolatus]|nr:hypothetical protein [Xenophilus aerolatus]